MKIQSNHIFEKKYKQFIYLLLWLVICHSSALYAQYSTERAQFKIKVKNEIVPYRVFAVFVLPQEMVDIHVLDGGQQREYFLGDGAGKTSPIINGRIKWQAPDAAGLQQLIIRDGENTDSIQLNVFVLVPLKNVKNGYLNGYRIGDYPNIPLKNLVIYQKPPGLIEVTQENREIPISPHFKLEQFLCKQQGDYPKYLVLKERLILKLEMILEELNEAGFQYNSLHIMSGYRTPYYNKFIGNVKYSRHVWGGAADIFVDEHPENGMMDDLNGDGKIDHKDAFVLYEIIDNLYGTPAYALFTGGLGKYKKTRNHGPFVHVDVRGFHARWGD